MLTIFDFVASLFDNNKVLEQSLELRFFINLWASSYFEANESVMLLNNLFSLSLLLISSILQLSIYLNLNSNIISNDY
jgi:hypothetical protein